MQVAEAGSTLRIWRARSVLPCDSSSFSSSWSESKWSSIARLEAPVMNPSRCAPAARASSTAYWISGLSTTGSISLGLALLAGRKRVPRPATGNTAVLISGFMKDSIANGPVGTLVHALTQILAGLEVRHVLAVQRHGFARLGIAPLPRRPEVQRKAAEAADLDPIALRQRVAHDLQHLLEREFDVLGRQVFLLGGYYFYQFGLRHAGPRPAPSTLRINRGPGY